MTDYRDMYRLRSQWDRYIDGKMDNNPLWRHCRECWALPGERCAGGEIPSYRGVSLGVHVTRLRGGDSSMAQHGPRWPRRIPRDGPRDWLLDRLAGRGAD